jgi:nucleotide-binding universal stress UspA family protein
MHVEIKRVGVATDFSEPAEHALYYGIALARQFNAELHLIHVLQDPGQLVSHPDFTAHGEAAREYFARMEQASAEGTSKPAASDIVPADEGALRFLRSLETGVDEAFERLPLSKQIQGLTVFRIVRYGNPVTEICRYARKQPLNLLILGTHGRTGLKHFLLGSVAERIVRVSPCPVLTVRHPQCDFIIDD